MRKSSLYSRKADWRMLLKRGRRQSQVRYPLRDRSWHASDGCVPQLGHIRSDVYISKKKYGDLGASEVRRLRQLEEENARLKRVVADLTLDKNILQEVIRKKV